MTSTNDQTASNVSVLPNAVSPDESRPQRKRRRTLLLSFVVCVLAPVILLSYYYASVASNRYASTAGFSVRGIETGAGLDGLGALTGLASAGSTTADSYIVLKYIESRALVEALDTDLNLKAIYSSEEVDWFSRLDSEAPIEKFVDYWHTRISTQFEPSSGIIEFTAQSFSSDHALQISERIIELVQALVNDLSAKARQDALQFAEREVEIQERRLRNALEVIRSFRTTEQSVDPTASASLDIQLLASLESRLVDINAKIAVQNDILDNDAPSLVALNRQAEAMRHQIEKRRAGISGTTSGDIATSAVSTQLSTFETLDIERRFAEQSYSSSLDSLEQARRDADRQQRYIGIHLYPQTAEISAYPRRLRNVLVSAFLLFAAWSIGTLITYSVRDHLT